MSITSRAALPRRNKSPRGPSDRRGTLIGALVAAVLAAVLFAVALGHHSSSPTTPGAAVGSSPVVVAGGLIHHGTLLDTDAAAGGLRIKQVPTNSVQAGALTTLDAVRGKVAAKDIFAGQQITSTDVGTDTGAITTRLTGNERAVTLPIDKLHGMTGDIATGDHVDVYASFIVQTQRDNRPIPRLRLLAQNVPVLHAPAANDSSGNGGTDSRVTLGASSDIAEQLAFTADYGKLWIAARPASGATTNPPSLVTIEGLLFGAKPAPVITTGVTR